MDFDNRSLNRKMGRGEFRRRAERVMLLLRSDHDPFRNDTNELQKRRINRARTDPFYFFRTYFPHYFDKNFAPFHYELVSKLERRPTLGDSAVVHPVVVAAPREFAKTTITSFGYVLHQICFKLRNFIVLISDTNDLASDLTGYIYLELCYNERIQHDFGKLVRDNWAVDDFITLNDIRLYSRGRGQRIRGIKHKQWRPDLVIMDDLENEASAKSRSRNRDLLNWINRTAYNIIDMFGNLFIIGTILNRKSALHTMVYSKEEPWCHWERLVYQALQKDGTSLWPAKFPIEILEEQRRMMGSVAFNQEKQNNPEEEDSYFQSDWIVYYTPEDIIGKELVKTAWYDPSVESGSHNDCKAMVTVGLDTEEGIFYVLDAYIKKTSLDSSLQAVISLHRQHNFLTMACEANVFQRLLLKEFDEAARIAGITLPIRGVVNHLSKETRIGSLSALVERGKIRFRKHQSNQDLLIEQLLYFPSQDFHDDGPDALEGAVRLARRFAEKPGDVSVEVADNYYHGRQAWNYGRRAKRFLREVA